MKINFYLPPDDPIRKELEQLGIGSDPASEYILTKKSPSLSYLPVKMADAAYYLDVKDIIYIESMGHNVLVHAKDGTYHSADRLKQLETILDSERFLRVSNAVIVNLRQIRRIEGSIMQKFILLLSDGSKVDVTRTYYYMFRDRLGI